MKLSVVWLALAVVVFGLAGPAVAEVVVDSVTATQLDLPYFVAVVVAHGGADLEVDLLVNGIALGEPAKIDTRESHGYTAWKIVYNQMVVTPGQTLTAVVTSLTDPAVSATKDAQCEAGKPRHQTAICK